MDFSSLSKAKGNELQTQLKIYGVVPEAGNPVHQFWKLSMDMLSTSLELTASSVISSLETNSYKKFWGQIDYLFVPSRADNSPNVIHEAKKLGIPVIASKIGGISELLTEEFDFGINIEDLNLDYLINMLLEVRNNEISEINRKLMTLNFSNYVSKSLQQHVQLYKELIALQSNKGFDR